MEKVRKYGEHINSKSPELIKLFIIPISVKLYCIFVPYLTYKHIYIQ